MVRSRLRKTTGLLLIDAVLVCLFGCSNVMMEQFLGLGGKADSGKAPVSGGTVDPEGPVVTGIPAAFTITVADIEDAGTIEVASGLTLSRSGSAKTIEVENAGTYDSIEWIYNGDTLGTGSTLTLSVNPADPNYNMKYDVLGAQLLTVWAVKGGVPYSVRVEFMVVL